MPFGPGYDLSRAGLDASSGLMRVAGEEGMGLRDGLADSRRPPADDAKSATLRVHDLRCEPGASAEDGRWLFSCCKFSMRRHAAGGEGRYRGLRATSSFRVRGREPSPPQ